MSKARELADLLGGSTPNFSATPDGVLKITGTKPVVYINETDYGESSVSLGKQGSNSYLSHDNEGNAGQFHIQHNDGTTVHKALSTYDTETVINEDGHDQDFRVESDSYTKMFMVDGGNNCLTIKNAVVTDAINVGGQSKIKVGGSSYATRFGYFDDTGGVHGFHVDTLHQGTWTDRRFVVRSDTGRVGIGTDNPYCDLQVAGSFRQGNGTTDFTKSTGRYLSDFASGASPTYAWNDSQYGWKFTNSNNCLSIINGGVSNNRQSMIQCGHSSVGTYSQYYSSLYLNKLGGAVYANTTSISDERYKTDIQPVEGALDKISQLGGYTFYRTDYETDKHQAGVIAQEVQKVLPQAIEYDEDDDKYGVTYHMLSALYIEAIKELKEKNEALEARIEALEKL
jgi:hypothetical protein